MKRTRTIKNTPYRGNLDPKKVQEVARSVITDRLTREDSSKNTYTVLGIDPGIANTGWSIVEGGTNYSLLETGLIKTKPSMETADRVTTIMTGLIEKLESIDLIAAELVFFGKNITSAMLTANVIGAIMFEARRREIPFYEVTPQEAKAALGMGASTPKAKIQDRVSRLFDKKLNQHTADSVCIGIAGIMQHRKTLLGLIDGKASKRLQRRQNKKRIPKR